MCHCALWVLILFLTFCSSFNLSSAAGIDSALSLDGDGDEVHVEHSQSLVMTDALTIEAWIYPVGPGSGRTGGSGGTVVNKEGEYVLSRFMDGTIHFAVTNENPGWEWIDSGYTVPEGTWVHLALTYSASANLFQLFANGGQVFSRTGTGEIGDRWEQHDDFKIGGRITQDHHFDGLIDEVRIWNIVRTGPEIRTTMNTSLQGNEPGLAGYWNFDDGTANDLSKNGNHGTLRENAAIVTGKTAKLFFSTIDWVNAGDTFALDLMIGDSADLAGWQLDIVFNPEVLEVVSITAGSFLSKDGGNTFFQEGEIDHTGGEITGMGGVLISRSGISGTGSLFSVTFEAKAAGEGQLQLRNVKLGSNNRDRIPYEIIINPIIIEKNYDVNGDGEVNILDLTLVAQNFGQSNPQADANEDGTIDIFDLIAVAQDLATPSLAPGAAGWQSKLNSQTIQNWIDMARAANDGSEAFQRGIANLKHLLSNVGNADLRSPPTETALFANYPNPFNPETWIPYHLASDSDVTLTIYDIKGAVVRRLEFGYQIRGQGITWIGVGQGIGMDTTTWANRWEAVSISTSWRRVIFPPPVRCSS